MALKPRALSDRAASGDSPDLLAFFSDVAGRLETAIRAETEALGENRLLDLGTTNRQKRQGLLELSRVIPRLSGTSFEAPVKARLSALSDLLEENRTAIDVQLRAVREVADIIARTIKDAESDGTYSRAGSGR